MQMLNNVPFKEIRVGDRVKSSFTGREGFVSKKINIEDASRYEDNELIIKWESGSVSMHWHFMYDGVWLM